MEEPYGYAAFRVYAHKAGERSASRAVQHPSVGPSLSQAVPALSSPN